MPGIQIIANNEAPKHPCVCPRCDVTYTGVNVSNVSSSSATTTAVNTSATSATSATVATTHTATQTIVYNHDVSVSLAQINELTTGPIIYALAPHQPLVAVAPVDPKGTPLTFTFNPRLVRDHLHRQFLSYLAEGVHSSFFVKGTAAAKIHDARQVLAVDRLDGYSSLQSFIYAHLLGSVNVALLEQAPRNSTLDGIRFWGVSSPDRCRLGAQAALELKIAGVPHVAADFHPTTVVPNALIDAVLNAVRLGAVWDLARGRVVAAPVHENQSLHHDAQILLGQVSARTGRCCALAPTLHSANSTRSGTASPAATRPTPPSTGSSSPTSSARSSSTAAATTSASRTSSRPLASRTRATRSRTSSRFFWLSARSRSTSTFTVAPRFFSSPPLCTSATWSPPTRPASTARPPTTLPLTPCARTSTTLPSTRQLPFTPRSPSFTSPMPTWLPSTRPTPTGTSTPPWALSTPPRLAPALTASTTPTASTKWAAAYSPHGYDHHHCHRFRQPPQPVSSNVNIHDRAPVHTRYHQQSHSEGFTTVVLDHLDPIVVKLYPTIPDGRSVILRIPADLWNSNS
ncbi:hypothetical protein VHUM_00639 [Vanrija humicola]|uniref:Uncharacterized protein n=1 Tax=Vanrija humicola TaxID=5417 RepID=A0A7D8Z5K3_VANHU|nr:hypothetical protein VHUM_00639 [Vanrija humicola]